MADSLPCRRAADHHSWGQIMPENEVPKLSRRRSLEEARAEMFHSPTEATEVPQLNLVEDLRRRSRLDGMTMFIGAGMRIVAGLALFWAIIATVTVSEANFFVAGVLAMAYLIVTAINHLRQTVEVSCAMLVEKVGQVEQAAMDRPSES